jgi:TM2 domain-containing membrane protein YozV
MLHRDTMYSTAVGYVLGILSFIPPFSGLLRFYLGHTGAGIAYSLTAGVVWIGNILDIVRVPQLVHEANDRWRKRRALPAGPGSGEADPRPLVEDLRRSSDESAAGPNPVEKAILLSAKRNKGITTPSEIVLETGVPLEQAKETLDSLVKRGFADIQVKKSGVIVYVFPEIVELMRDTGAEDL